MAKRHILDTEKQLKEKIEHINSRLQYIATEFFNCGFDEEVSIKFFKLKERVSLVIDNLTTSIYLFKQHTLLDTIAEYELEKEEYEKAIEEIEKGEGMKEEALTRLAEAVRGTEKALEFLYLIKSIADFPNRRKKYLKYIQTGITYEERIGCIIDRIDIVEKEIEEFIQQEIEE